MLTQLSNSFLGGGANPQTQKFIVRKKLYNSHLDLCRDLVSISLVYQAFNKHVVYFHREKCMR